MVEYVAFSHGCSFLHLRSIWSSVTHQRHTSCWWCGLGRTQRLVCSDWLNHKFLSGLDKLEQRFICVIVLILSLEYKINILFYRSCRGENVCYLSQIMIFIKPVLFFFLQKNPKHKSHKQKPSQKKMFPNGSPMVPQSSPTAWIKAWSRWYFCILGRIIQVDVRRLGVVFLGRAPSWRTKTTNRVKGVPPALGGRTRRRRRTRWTSQNPYWISS